MDTATTQVTGAQPAFLHDPVRKEMAQFEPDRQALKSELDLLFKDLMHEAITAVETCLPEFRVTGSADARLHASLRSRLLNVGNGKMRTLPEILKNYIVQQVYQRTLVLKESVSTPVVTGGR